MEREEEIRLAAYYLWESEGCPEGRAVEHWAQAELLCQKSNDLEAATEDTQPIEPQAMAVEPAAAEAVSASEKKPVQKRAARTAKRPETKAAPRRRTTEKTVS